MGSHYDDDSSHSKPYAHPHLLRTPSPYSDLQVSITPARPYASAPELHISAQQKSPHYDQQELPEDPWRDQRQSSSARIVMLDQHSPEQSVNSIRSTSEYEVSIHDNIREPRHQDDVMTLRRKIFSFDYHMPSDLLTTCRFRDEREFAVTRYTAATCDPSAFMDEEYTLRSNLFDPPRRTEIFIVISLHDEDQELFCRTMHGVMKNIAHLCTRDKSDIWGQAGWKKVVVCIVSDGLATANPRTLSVITTMGAYRDGYKHKAVNFKPVTAHIYEYTSHLSVTPSMEIQHAEHGITPVQIIFCLPGENIGINPNRWPFHAFAPVLQPNVYILLDVGTTPAPKSIYHIWKTFNPESCVDQRSPSVPQVDAHLRLVDMKVKRKIRQEMQYRGGARSYHSKVPWLTSLRLKILKVVLFPTRIRFMRS